MTTFVHRPIYDRIGLIKLIRQLSEMGLREAKELVDSYILPENETDQERESRKSQRDALSRQVIIDNATTRAIAKGVGQTEQQLLLQLEEWNGKLIRIQNELDNALSRQNSLQLQKDDLSRQMQNDIIRTNQYLEELDEVRRSKDNMEGELSSTQDELEDYKNLVNENLKSILKLLYSNQGGKAFDLLLDMLSPRKNSYNHAVDVPF